MYNLRYHIASLVSVFLALALGLVLGGLVVRQGTLDRQQGALVEGLRQEFSDLRAENAALKAENGLSRAYAQQMTDAWTADRLVGRTVMVVGNSGRNNGMNAATTAIESAGGTVVTVTILKPGLGISDPSVRSKVVSLASDPGDVAGSLAASLAAEWAAPLQRRPLTEALQDAGVLSVEGLGRGVAVAGYVDLAMSDAKGEAAALAIGGQMAEAKVSAVGAELMGAKSGVAAAAADSGMSAFDTLGTEVGRYTLVALLTGAKAGLYGVSDDAVAPFPPVPTP